MILDGYWKKELKQIRRSLLIWSKIGRALTGELSEHKINKDYLYSAAIIRKIFEDEKDAEAELKEIGAQLPALEIIKIQVPVKRYMHVADDKFFANSRVFLEDYDTKNAIDDTISLYTACAQIIHSYAWGVIYSGKRIYGVLLASDREKEKDILLLSVKDWVTVIEEVVEKTTIY